MLWNSFEMTLAIDVQAHMLWCIPIGNALQTIGTGAWPRRVAYWAPLL